MPKNDKAAMMSSILSTLVKGVYETVKNQKLREIKEKRLPPGQTLSMNS